MTWSARLGSARRRYRSEPADARPSPRAPRDLGCRIKRFTKVIGLQRTPTGEWCVETDQGDITCEIVVNAAGYRAGEIMAMVGQYMPIVSMSHQYLVTEVDSRSWKRARRSCRCCAIPTSAGICARSGRGCCSGRTNGRRRRTGSTVFLTTSPTSCGRTTWSGWRNTSTTPSSACRSWARAACSA